MWPGRGGDGARNPGADASRPYLRRARVLAASTHRLDPALAAGLGTGFCGALTTYSTFSYETLRLLEGRAGFYAAANIVASVAAGLGAATIGLAVGTAMV